MRSRYSHAHGSLGDCSNNERGIQRCSRNRQAEESEVYNLLVKRPEPLVRRQNRFTVAGRTRYDGRSFSLRPSERDDLSDKGIERCLEERSHRRKFIDVAGSVLQTDLATQWERFRRASKRDQDGSARSGRCSDLALASKRIFSTD
jgi:hypothetical protein